MTPWQAAFGRRIGAVLALAATPALCLAHLGADAHVHQGATDALRAGFLHPLSGADHWAAMLALGLWSAMTARRVIVAPVIFAAMMAVGAMLGFMNAPIGAVEPLIACSVLVLGLLIAMRWQLPSWAAAMLAAGFALVHGVAHGLELAGPEQYLSLAGMLTATLLIMSLGMLVGRWLPRHLPWLPRLGGAALSLFGVVLLGPFA